MPGEPGLAEAEPEAADGEAEGPGWAQVVQPPGAQRALGSAGQQVSAWLVPVPAPVASESLRELVWAGYRTGNPIYRAIPTIHESP